MTQPAPISRTSIYVAAGRAVGAHEPDPSAKNPDYLAENMIAKIDMAKIPEAQKPFVQRFLDLTKNEPWIFGLPVGGEREYLREFGLDLREMFTVGGEDSAKRYLTRADGAQAIAEAMARMATPARWRPLHPRFSSRCLRSGCVNNSGLPRINWQKPLSVRTAAGLSRLRFTCV